MTHSVTTQSSQKVPESAQVKAQTTPDALRDDRMVDVATHKLSEQRQAIKEMAEVSPDVKQVLFRKVELLSGVKQSTR